MMATFKDKSGTVWDITLTVSALKRVLTLVDVDLARLVETEDASGRKRNPIDEWARLINDPIQVCNVLWAIVKPVAEAKGMTDEQFGEELEGNALSAGTDALEVALRDFFSARHPEFARMLAKMSEVDKQGKAELSRRITEQILGSGEVLKQAHARMDELLLGLGIGSSGSGAASSG